MGRKRKSHKNLPERVYVHRKSYRFHPRKGSPIRLSGIDDYGGMLRALAELHAERPIAKTMAAVFDRYELDVLPDKAKSTQKDQARQLKNLRRTFGHMDPNDLRQPHAIQYRDKRAQKAKTAANREMQLLKHVCTKAVEWSAMDFNHLRGMRMLPTKPRQRYVTDEELGIVRDMASPMIQCVIDLAVLTGLRRGDIFRLKQDGYDCDGLLVKPSKTSGSTGVTLLFEVTDELKSVIERAISIPPRKRPWIVCNRKAEAYTKNGFDSVWGRLMRKATDPKTSSPIEKFEFRDFRRKSASDEIDEVVAQQRLGHASVSITNRVYRVKPRRVQPLR